MQIGLINRTTVASAVVSIHASVLSLYTDVLLFLIGMALPVGLVKVQEDLSKFLIGPGAVFHHCKSTLEASWQGLLKREVESIEVPTRLIGMDLEAGEVMVEVVTLYSCGVLASGSNLYNC